MSDTPAVPPESDLPESEDNGEINPALQHKELPDLSELEYVIPDEVEPILEKLDNADKKTLISAFIGVSVQKSWSGPLPHPDTLKGYNECFEGGAKAVFDLTKSQSEHRMNLENTVITRELNQSGKGQNYAMGLAVSFLAVAGFLIYVGHEISGTIIGSIDLVALVGVFIYGKNNINNQIKSKRQDEQKRLDYDGE